MDLSISSLPKENTCGCAETDSGDNANECMCPATGLVQIIGRKYALRILTVIGEHRSIRFKDLKGVMDDMSSSTLTIRLVELERAGLILRKTYSSTPPRVDYTLTVEGRKLRHNLFALSKYASQRSPAANSLAAD